MFENQLRRTIKIHQKIFRAIDNFDSYIIQAGGCADKTYILIESLKYFLQHRINELRKNN